MIFGLSILKGRWKLPKLLLYEKIILLFLPVAFIGVLIGVANSNDTFYILSDTYKYAFFGFVFMATLIAVRPENAMAFCRVVMQFVLLSFLLTVVFQFIGTALDGPQRSTPIGGAFIILPYFLAVEASGGNDPVFRTSKILRAGLIALILASVLLSFSRSVWTGALIEVILSLVLIRMTFRTHVSLLSTVTFVVACFLIIIPVLRVGAPDTLKRIDSFKESRVLDFTQSLQEISPVVSGEGKAKRSLSQKFSEGTDAVNHLRAEGSVFDYVVGMGNGAEYRSETGSITSKVVSSSGKDLNHQIHNAAFAAFFRQGLLGLSLLIAFFLTLIFGLYTASRRIDGPARVIVAGFFLGSCAFIVREMSLSGMFWSPIYVVLLALVGQLIRHELAKRRASKATTAGGESGDNGKYGPAARIGPLRDSPSRGM